MSCSRTQHSDGGKDRTRGPSVSGQALTLPLSQCAPYNMERILVEIENLHLVHVCVCVIMKETPSLKPECIKGYNDNSLLQGILHGMKICRN